MFTYTETSLQKLMISPINFVNWKLGVIMGSNGQDIVTCSES